MASAICLPTIHEEPSRSAMENFARLLKAVVYTPASYDASDV